MDDACPQPRPRHDGWTIERQARFLATLEQTGSVRSAASAAGMSRAGAYRFRDRPQGIRFSRAWDLALGRRRERALQALLAKATSSLVRRGKSHNGDSVGQPVSGWKSGEGDTPGGITRHRQPGQACRVSPHDRARLRALMDAAAAGPEMRGLHSKSGPFAPKFIP